MSDSKAALAAQRENVVWRVDKGAQSYALRFHRPGYRTAAELESELHWMAMLADSGLSVPHPVKAADGQLIHEIDSCLTDVLTWLDGAPIGASGEFHDISDPLALCHQIGAEMARLHDLTDAWAPPAGFTRPQWRQQGLLGEHPLWGRFWDHPALTHDERSVLLRARDTARDHLARIEADLDQGLIHADLLTENIMIHQGQLSLIDFDDAAFGYRDFELATFLIRFLKHPAYPELRAALCTGYATRRRVDQATLDFMLMLRSLTYVGWIISRIDEPGGKARSIRNITTALPLARAYLEGTP